MYGRCLGSVEDISDRSGNVLIQKLATFHIKVKILDIASSSNAILCKNLYVWGCLEDVWGCTDDDWDYWGMCQ